jgi:hypothetical protein
MTRPNACPRRSKLNHHRSSMKFFRKSGAAPASTLRARSMGHGHTLTSETIGTSFLLMSALGARTLFATRS